MDEQESSVLKVDSRDSESQEELEWEMHREFVREIDNRFSKVYGYGGVIVLAVAVGGLLLTSHWWGWLSLMTWVLSGTAFVVSLFVLRSIVHRFARLLYAETKSYCSKQNITMDQLRERFGNDGMYQYFESVFEVIEREVE